MSIEFKVVNTPRPDRLEEAITELLNAGWELRGPLVADPRGGLTQSLIRSTGSKKSETKKVSK